MAATRADILVTGRRFVGAEQLALLEGAGFTVEVSTTQMSARALAAALRNRMGYIWGNMETVSASVLRGANALRVIGFPGSGYTEYITGWQEATRRGIAIATAVGLNAASVAEYAVALMLALERRIVEQAASQSLAPTPVRELSALTLGTIGTGRTGLATAALARRLGMRVLAVARSPGAAPPGDVTLVSMDDLVRHADIVSVHVDRIHGRGYLARIT